VAISSLGLRSLFRAKRGISEFASASPRNRSAPRNDTSFNAFILIYIISFISSILIPFVSRRYPKNINPPQGEGVSFLSENPPFPPLLKGGRGDYFAVCSLQSHSHVYKKYRQGTYAVKASPLSIH